MKRNDNDLKFDMSYGALYNRRLELQASAERDATILISRGIPKATIDSITVLWDEFSLVPSDETMQGLIKIEVEKRDEVFNALVILIRDVQGIAETTFGKKSGELLTFAPFNLTELTNTEVLRLTDVVISRGTTYLLKMKDYGLTNDMLVELESKKTLVEDQEKKLDLSEGNRKQTTVLRHQRANTLYDVMEKICTVGYNYYRDRDAVKAEDYLINDIPNNVQERNGTVEKASAISREVLGISETTKFQLKVSIGDNLEFYFSRTEGGPVGNKSVTVLYNPNNFTEVKAADLGYSKADGFIFFCIKNPSLDEAGVYRVKVIG